MTGAGDVWSAFTRDPRLTEHAALRASDADREVVHQVLTEAYADGRLDRDEFDAAQHGRRLGAHARRPPGLIEGLVPLTTSPCRWSPARA